MTSNDEKQVKVCPNCGSTNVCSGYNALNKTVKDYCGDCGFNEMEYVIQEFPKMAEKEAIKLRKRLKKK